MPDTLVNLTSPTEVRPPRCAKNVTSRKSTKPGTIALNESPAQPAVSTTTSDIAVLLRRELADAERIVNAGVPDDSPLISAYHDAQDRFVNAPTTSMLGVLLKLERIAEVEDLDQHLGKMPNLIWPRMIKALLRDLRALTARPAVPSLDTRTSFGTRETHEPRLDVVAIHREADKEVDEIYRLHARIANGIDLLREISDRIFVETPQDGAKLLYLVDTLDEAASSVVNTNDRLCNAIDPLNPTVLDEQVA